MCSFGVPVSTDYTALGSSVIDDTGVTTRRRHRSPPSHQLYAWASDLLSGTCYRLLPVAIANPHDTMACLQWSSLNTVFPGNAAGHFLWTWTNGRRHHQATHGQGIRLYRHRERKGPVFSLVKPRRGELRRTPRRTASDIHRRTWTERAMCRERQAGLTELRGTFVFNHGETDMGDKGSKDKGNKE